MNKALLKKVLGFVALGLGVVAIIMFFLPAGELKANSEYNYNGFEVMFGCSDKISGISMDICAFSFMNFVKFLLFIAGIVFALLAVLGKGGKAIGFVAVGCLLLAAIFSFCTVAFAVPAEVSMYGFKGKAWEHGDIQMCAGPILSAVFGLLAAGSVGATLFIKD